MRNMPEESFMSKERSYTGYRFNRVRVHSCFYSFNKLITTEYILGTWVLKENQ